MSIDLKEFEHLFNQYFESLKGFLYYKTGDIEVAEDLVQETFLKLWEQRQGINKTTVKSLLYTMAANLSKNYLKHQTVVFNFANKQSLSGSSETPQHIMETVEFEQKLEKAIGELSEPNRTTFLMNRIEKLTYGEIAERLDISVKAVEKRMSTTLKQLYDKLGHKL